MSTANPTQASTRTPAKRMTKTKWPSIYRDGGAYVYVYEFKGKQYQHRFRTVAEAKEAKRTRNPKERPESRARFDEYAAAWVVSYRGRNSKTIEDTTRASYRDSIERLAIPHFKRTPLNEIELRDVKAFTTSLEKRGLSPNSIRAHVAPLRAMFAEAVENGLLRTNPGAVRVIVQSDGPVKKPPTPKREDFPRLLAALPTERWQMLMMFIGATGVRVSEALGLEVDDFNFDTGLVRIERQHYRGVTKKLKTQAGERNAKINLTLAAALKTYIEANGCEVKLVDDTGKARLTTIMFATLDGKHLGYRNILRVLNRALVDLGIYEKGMAFHSLRRLAASYYEAEGHTDTQIGALLGHADGGRLARKTYLRAIDGTGDALPDNVIPMPQRPRRDATL